jgi:hypothetical protein
LSDWAKTIHTPTRESAIEARHDELQVGQIKTSDASDVTVT